MTLLRDLAEERAAIIEDGEGCSRWLAQETAAKQMGFKTWAELRKASK